VTSPIARAAAASRDPFLILRRVERQQQIIEALAASSSPLTAGVMATRFRVGRRTVERDIRRLREAGVPLETRRGPGGGVRIAVAPGPRRLTLAVSEIAALLATLTSLGPTATDTAASAARALVDALTAED
jgi:predicted DNA-binding transcriptional regulator YafY